MSIFYSFFIFDTIQNISSSLTTPLVGLILLFPLVMWFIYKLFIIIINNIKYYMNNDNDNDDGNGNDNKLLSVELNPLTHEII